MNEEIKKFIIASAIVENKPKHNYINLLNEFNESYYIDKH